ncbi:hypothetical protein ONZ43_g320 [Nemania bipapillata]|uniref:Uncharacterized protein n=1 Tax=Nemania bipapillata TaxID=110536 RepID=A0ACC2J8J3_9PEZI|nr:hypothetical protein ONZ43_g320 [Nemania bipapillata]
MADLDTSSNPSFVSSGDAFILDDLPANFTVGCDATSFNSTQPFPGFRDIPPGVHLIWVAPSESTSSRNGYWICTPERDDTQLGQIYVKQWDKFNEVLCGTDSRAMETLQDQRLEQNVAGEVIVAEEAQLYTSETSRLRFTFPMDARLINPAARGAERTRQALDPTGWIIDKLESPDCDYRPEDLTGEFQFAFLVGMHLGNFSCLEQWFFLATQLIFRSFSLAVDRPQQARDLIQTFHAQLLYNDRYLQGDVFDLMPEHARKLRLALTTYKTHLDEKLLALGTLCSPDQNAVSIAFSSLESWLRQLGWDLRGEYVRSGNVMLEDGEMVQAELSDFEDEDERGEFAPTIVEVENGREAGLLSWDT